VITAFNITNALLKTKIEKHFYAQKPAVILHIITMPLSHHTVL